MTHKCCPFCRGRDLYVESDDVGSNEWFACVVCNDCQTRGPDSKIGCGTLGRYFPTRSGAEEQAWLLWDVADRRLRRPQRLDVSEETPTENR